MKVIPLSEAKARLSLYGKLCQQEPIVVTVNGLPVFQLVPIQDDDDLINQLLEHNPKFREALEARLREKSVSAAEAARQL